MKQERIEKCFKGIYLPTYCSKTNCWGVETSHGIEVGDFSYVADQFCWDSVIYYFYIDKDKSYPEHVHGGFEAVLQELVCNPENFSIEGFEDLYSIQEQRVLMNVQDTIKQVKLLGRPLTREEARENNKRIIEQLENK